MVTERRQRGLRIVLLTTFMTVLTQSIYAQSMLERIMTVDDPELGECLRAAIQHIPVPRELTGYSTGSPEYRKAKLEYNTKKIDVARAVTESYAQIKLLDSQIEQIDSRLEIGSSANAPNILQHELVLAKAELESKRLQEFARLRGAIGIIPRHAFGEIQLGQLDSWITLDVVNNEHVLVFDMKKPFTDDRRSQRFDFVNDMSYDKAIKYVNDVFNESAKQPLRIDILHRQDSTPISKQLHVQLEKMAQQQSIEMDTDIRLASNIQHGSGLNYYHIKGRIGGNSSSGTYRGKRVYRLRTVLDANALKGDIIRTFQFTKPATLPIRFVLEYGEASLESAKQTAATIKDLAKEHHLSDFVTVTLQPTKQNWQFPEEEK
jgi:hypothetical protein